jgi:hypothetical protein
MNFRKGTMYLDVSSDENALVEKENWMVSMIRTGTQYFQIRSEFVIPVR